MCMLNVSCTHFSHFVCMLQNCIFKDLKMIDFSLMGKLLPKALGETLYMVGASSFFALVLGLPLGWALFHTEKRCSWLYKLLSLCVNAGRSFPFAILMIALIPFTKWITGSSLGTSAAIVPLSVAAAPFFARMVESSFKEVSASLVEAVSLMGASSFQIFTKVLLSESLPSQIRALTMTTINLTGYSAMAGLIGGGGLGQVAMQYGYQRFNTPILLATVILLLLVVECFQLLGNFLAKRVSHG
jgi:D-methionine transport system permease protein